MYDRMQTLSTQNMDTIHGAALQILETTGVAFNHKESLDIFKSAGFNVDGSVVRFSQKQVQKIGRASCRERV